MKGFEKRIERLEQSPRLRLVSARMPWEEMNSTERLDFGRSIGFLLSRGLKPDASAEEIEQASTIAACLRKAPPNPEGFEP